jgi:hypothetical protein
MVQDDLHTSGAVLVLHQRQHCWLIASPKKLTVWRNHSLVGIEDAVNINLELCSQFIIKNQKEQQWNIPLIYIYNYNYIYIIYCLNDKKGFTHVKHIRNRLRNVFASHPSTFHGPFKVHQKVHQVHPISTKHVSGHRGCAYTECLPTRLCKPSPPAPKAPRSSTIQWHWHWTHGKRGNSENMTRWHSFRKSHSLGEIG